MSGSQGGPPQGLNPHQQGTWTEEGRNEAAQVEEDTDGVLGRRPEFQGPPKREAGAEAADGHQGRHGRRQRGVKKSVDTLMARSFLRCAADVLAEVPLCGVQV